MIILNMLVTFVVVMLIMSGATGLIIGGPDKGLKIIQWELKQLSKIGRWALKHLFRLIVDVCQWVHSKL